MLTNISWADYFIAVSIVLTTYYLFVGLRYFSVDIKNLISGKMQLKIWEDLSHSRDEIESFRSSDENSTVENLVLETSTGNDFTEVEHLIERLKSVISDAASKKLILQEFKQYLYLLLQEYPGIKNSPYRTSINEFVASECEKYGAVTLSEDEVELLWESEM